MTPDQYARAVRDALADHPDREELLEDLDDHLAEIAAESDQPIEERLGPPQAYAEELAAAYGERPRRGRTSLRGRLAGAHARLMAQAPYRALAGFLPELRPGWWVLRGYLLATLLLVVAGDGGLVPGDVAGWVVVAALVLVSVWFGRRTAGGRVGGRSRGRVTATAALVANGLAVVTLLAQVEAADSVSGRTQVATARPEVWMRNTSGDGVYNIRPYAKDGTPLTGVYLYDQDGNPLITRPEQYGFTVDRSCGEPVLNRYPLPLVDRRSSYEARTSTPTPPTCPTPTAEPTTSATPTATATPAPSSTR
ncbi:hypothetical protein SAMN05421874_102101 [Nonomuraea maritima]|uniref:Proline-rich protein n=1 Tax=Nonomuraea maritima TaxID=683260 RepID=A0A1G8UFZ9_9ACTN|nr:hypothetical protein [Nonomuraea maritima]SDJ52679.1 hypothetical protein SAMN05421874_102101 [Nonomuraea maritima]